MGVADPANASAATNTFALPIHSDELGRLPLHGFTMSSMVTNAGVTNAGPGPSTEPAPPTLESSWFGGGAGPSGLTTMAAPADADNAPSPSADMAGGLDAAGLASMFGVGVGGGLDDPQQVYENLFANMPATYAGAQEFPGAMGIGVGVMGAPGPSSGQVPGAPGQEGFADADNTLAMWSSAPSDFQ